MFHYGEKTKELLQTRHHVSYNSPVWSGLRGSNPPPQPWEGRALPDELNPHIR